MTDILVIAGLSGAGRSQAADSLEDLGWFVIDNMPPALLARVAEMERERGSAELVALVIDVRINFGGEDPYGLAIASRLATRPYVAYTKVARIDPVDRNQWSPGDPSERNSAATSLPWYWRSISSPTRSGFRSIRPGRFRLTSIMSGRLEARIHTKRPRFSERLISAAIIQ